MDTVDRFSMQDIESLTGIKAHTLRIWEKRYRIVDPGRTASNIRYYNNDQLRLLLDIRVLNQSGHKISAIAAMSDSERLRQLDTLKSTLSSTSQVEERLLMSLLKADEPGFSQAFSSIVHHLGLEQAFISHLLPFFERIGILWQMGTITPAHEHFFFHLVRQKLLAATDSLGYPGGPNKGTVLLFLPEHELHELGLLFYNYALKRRNYRTIYLGQSVPLAGLEQMVRLHHPQRIITGWTNAMNPIRFHEWRATLMEKAAGTIVYYTGPVPSILCAEYKDLLITGDLIKWLFAKSGVASASDSED